MMPVDLKKMDMPAGQRAPSRRAGQSAAPIVLLHVTTVPIFLPCLAGQAAYVRRWGMEVHALASPGEELGAFGAREGVAVHAVLMERRIAPWRDLIAVFRIFGVLRSIRPDIVHAHTPKGGLLGTLAAWMARVPVRIYHLHGLRFATLEGFKRSVLLWTEKIACLLAHRVLCVSRSVGEVAVAEGLCPSRKLRVLGRGSINGVDMERFRPADAATRASARAALGIGEEAFVVGFIGRIVRDKGIVELTAAWRALRDRFADLRLLLVGPLEPHNPVPSEVLETLRSDKRVILLGLDWNTPPLYAAMDLLVLPTYREGLPGTLLEGAAMAVPIVATRVTGCVDVVEDGVSGTLVPPRDVAALVEAIARYRTAPNLRREHAEAGRARVLRDFRQEAIWSETRAEYSALLAGQGCRPLQLIAAPSEPERGEL